MSSLIYFTTNNYNFNDISLDSNSDSDTEETHETPHETPPEVICKELDTEIKNSVTIYNVSRSYLLSMYAILISLFK